MDYTSAQNVFDSKEAIRVKKKLLVELLMALLLTLVYSSEMAACNESGLGPDGSSLTCDGTHTYTYNYLNDKLCEKFTYHYSGQTCIKKTRDEVDHVGTMPPISPRLVLKMAMV